MRGERNSRGDSNWVPVEAIEKIESITWSFSSTLWFRCNGWGGEYIITKPVTNDLHGSLSYYTNQPEDSDEGATNRVGFNLSGALIKEMYCNSVVIW